ncbi:MAG: monofunctional biosynthetic peptidoglycan transglycosylase [Gammaproteobacteria bacterium]|nr:monofunctional biosynthetic peptidoglycan transglycosylase [Gammaproteobacteria bacterium]
MAVSKRKKQRAKWQRWLRYAGAAMLAFVFGSVLLVLPLRWLEPATTAFMLLDDSGRNPLLHEWVDWPQLGTGIALAAVASEDQRFADHFGLDPTAIRKSLGEQETRGYLRGASTISQQTAKNLFLWRGRSFVRKGLEAWFTLVLEICLPKRRILEIYLNIAEFGPGIYGAGAASQQFFGVMPKWLTDRQAALLAAVLPNPRKLRADQPTDYLWQRSDWIVRQMWRLRREGWMTRITR